MRELTKQEQNAINTLHRLAKRWPQTLMLMAGTGSLCVLFKEDYLKGDAKLHRGECVIETIDIFAEGGDPW